QGEPARRGSLAQAQSRGDLGRAHLPVRQQRNDCILYRRAERASVRRSMGKSLFAIRHQKLVEVRVSTGDRAVLDAPDESQLICSCPKGDVAAEVGSEFRSALVAS